jgi:dipeptidyl aminopeptidase/acylaminoacyl peptidase
MDRDEYLEELLGLPNLWNALVSRDGRRVAWTWAGAGPAADVYVAPTGASAAPTRLTDTEQDSVVVSWVPDGSAVIVGQDRDGDERVRLFRVDVDRPRTMIALTAPDPLHYTRGGSMHPNGRWLVYAANYDVEAACEVEPFLVLRHDIATGERRVLARPERAAFGAPALNGQGTHILYARSDRHPAGSQVWLVDIEGGGDREVLNFGDDVKTTASWMPDGRRALVTSETPGHKRVGTWDALGGGEVQWLVDDPSRSVESAHAPFGASSIVLREVIDARLRASLLDPRTGAETPLPFGAGNLSPLAPAADGVWLALAYSSRQPIDIVRFRAADLPDGPFESVSRIWDRTRLTADDLSRAQDFRWRGDDGLPLQGWLYRAAGEPVGTIVCVHGGPTAHSWDAVKARVQYFVRCGFNVLEPNYRGSTGFGLAFREAIKQDGWGGREQEDIRAGIEALFAAGIAVPGRVGITGTSYGGYSSWCAITRWPTDVVAAAAPICGMTDLVIDYETTRPDLRPYSEEMMGGSPGQVPGRYQERSPIHFVDCIRGCLLIVQGMRDPNVTPENVRAVRRALDGAGIAYEVLAFGDEGHGVRRPHNERVLFKRLVEFFTGAFAGGAPGGP